jgi:DNA processing protein
VSASSPGACESCLRRAWLVAALAPYIERVATGQVGRRSPELLALEDDALALAVAPHDADRLLAENRALEPASLREQLELAGVWACCQHDPAYPPGLRDPADAPPALFGRGDSLLLARLVPDGCVTVVGARRAGTYGRDVACALGRGLASAGMVVVSGLAFGIDAAAHRGALETGVSAAVLGCGADVAYPVSHRKLYREVCEAGLVLSELPPGATPWKWTFPARNRIMAALAGMTVVVEAASRSGSLITAGQAQDLGRDLGAVPGPVSSWLSAGTNELLAEGAKLVRDAQDVLDAMLGVGVRELETSGPALSPTLAEILDAIERGSEDRDSIALTIAAPAAFVARSLAELELLGYVRGTMDGRHLRTSLARPDAALASDSPI